MNEQLELQFIEYKLKAFIDACSKLVQENKKVILLRPFNKFAAELVSKLSADGIPVTFYVSKEECEVPLPSNVSLHSDEEPIEATILFASEAKTLPSYLMKYLDLEQGVIIAPITGDYYSNKPLFLISIPKSGTHLLYKLAQSFGYAKGIVCPDKPLPGFWYCLEYSNSHTSAKDFFIDTVRRSPFGNRAHPFTRSPAIFIYRNPMDIVASEANYYHKDGNAVFWNYLSGLSFEERLLKLIDDPWLLGSIRDRIGNFIAWLDFQNVIPVSFEELIGPKGGGSMDAQIKLIWSLQLKLHVPGNPRQFSDKVFDKDSPTFHKGQIGSYRRYFTDKAYRKFYTLPQDFMELLGYDSDDKSNPLIIPKRAEEFRKRPVIFSEVDFDNTPIGIEYDYLGYNIVKYKGLYYGIPKTLGQVDLANLEGIRLSRLCSDVDLNAVKRKVLLGKGVSRVLLWQMYMRKLWKLCSHIVGRLKVINRS